MKKQFAILMSVATLFLGQISMACGPTTSASYIGSKSIIEELQSGGLICNLMRRDGTHVNGASSIRAKSLYRCANSPQEVVVRTHSQQVTVTNIQRFDEGLFSLQLDGSDFAVATCQLL